MSRDRERALPVACISLSHEGRAGDEMCDEVELCAAQPPLTWSALPLPLTHPTSWNETPSAWLQCAVHLALSLGWVG